MDKLRGIGSTFSTSGQRWHPFPGFNRKIIQQKARLRRLKAKGLIAPIDKATARQLVTQACAAHPVRRV